MTSGICILEDVTFRHLIQSLQNDLWFPAPISKATTTIHKLVPVPLAKRGNQVGFIISIHCVEYSQLLGLPHYP